MPAFEVYMPKQAVTSRWIFAACGAALALFGCYQLFYTLPDAARGHAFGTLRPLGEEFPISWALITATLTAIAGSYGVFWAANHRRLVEFFGETEVEMTKVSWASRKEVVGSSIVVIATVVILGVWIALVDVILSAPWIGWVKATIDRLFG